MSAWVGTLQLAALVGGSMALASAAACALLYPLLRRHVLRLAPEARARLTVCVAAAPVALPALGLVLCLLPSVLGLLGVHRDHCPEHTEHRHLCVTHHPPALPPPWSAVALLGAAPVAMALGVGAAGASRSRLLRHSLELGASGALRDGVVLVASPLPLSVTAGVLHPRIFVSERFAAELSAEQLEVVIEHECAHARRRDGLRKLAASSLSCVHVPALRRHLLGDLSLACEQACDADAARRVGDRVRVAETILAAERLLPRGHASRAVCAFGGSTVPARVAQLLDGEPAQAGSRGAAWAALGAGVVVALFLADPLHHLAEHALALVLR